VGKITILTLYSALIIVPLFVVLFGSFRTLSDLFESPLSVPLKPTIEPYRQLMTTADIGVPFVNSTIVTVLTLVVTLVLASLAAYGISRIRGWRGWTIWGALVVGMSIPAQSSVVPLFVIFRAAGMTDSIWGLTLAEIVHSIPVAVFILGGFMRSLPQGVYEAAAIDGASSWRTYTRVAIPLSAPSLAATAIFLFVIVWNDLLYPLFLTTTPGSQTLPLALLSFQGEFNTNYPAIFAGVIVASLPVVVLYVFLQRYFVAGMTAGAMKG
jgi:raffinose/stachyose/melibiose transport system permease protein